MNKEFKLTMAQLNASVGDFDGNLNKARDAYSIACKEGADMLAFPEMFLTGYQTQDLVQKSAFVEDAQSKLIEFAKECSDGPTIGIGVPLQDGDKVYNAYAILQNGKIITQIRKHHLPNYKVFDEKRVFDSGEIHGPYVVNGVRIGSPICEDAWFPDVCETLEETGAEILISPNGSPYYRGKFDKRISLMVSRAVENNLPMAYLNLVGGQDDQVFDGGSFVINSDGALALQMPLFEENIETITFKRTQDGWVAQEGKKASYPDHWEQDYHVMVLALRDYMKKTGFKKALLGMSGGIDSALVAAIACDALGSENVRLVMLPSKYTSQNSLDDAANCANLLKAKIQTIPISDSFNSVLKTLEPIFEGLDEDTTEENIQSRLRGLLLMGLSNKFNEMLLTTGNKSEVSVGYSTIYGDMAGGFNPIKDLYKVRVFETSRWRNNNYFSWMKGSRGEVIPNEIIQKPPTAELRNDQKDSDSLPDYEILDGILEMLMDNDASVADCVVAGYELSDVKHVEKLLYLSEYKRFQSAPGTRLSLKAFWLDRRYPIANKWRDNK
ncbi:NAD+ synthase [Amylibacter sp.]|nr:NAD+ synthase [Amylibacter sp.]